MPGFSFGELRKEYETLWSSMKIPAGSIADVDKLARGIVQGKPRYDQVSNATGVPWYVVGIIHAMEASLNFKTHLHNGDPLTARTVQVPRGRPPFGTPPFEWEDSAIDALTLKDLDDVRVWSIERIAFQLEAYNGGVTEHETPELIHPICGASPTITKRESSCATGCSTRIK